MRVRHPGRFMSRLDLTHCLVLSGRDLVGIATLRDLTLAMLN